MSSKRENSGKRPDCGQRRRFLAWSTLALFSLLLGRRHGSWKPPVDNAALPGREALYYRKVEPGEEQAG